MMDAASSAQEQGSNEIEPGFTYQRTRVSSFRFESLLN